MTISEFEKRIKGKYEVSKVSVNTSYVIKLGSKGCVTLQYVDNNFKKFIVDGKEKEEIEKLLLN